MQVILVYRLSDLGLADFNQSVRQDLKSLLVSVCAWKCSQVHRENQRQISGVMLQV